MPMNGKAGKPLLVGRLVGDGETIRLAIEVSKAIIQVVASNQVLDCNNARQLVMVKETTYRCLSRCVERYGNRAGSPYGCLMLCLDIRKASMSPS